jgi:dienelactone hydrolase
MRLNRYPALLALLLLLAGGAAFFLPAPSDQISITSEHLQGIAYLPARLYQPEGAGPFPALVLLHGCAGVLNKHAAWAGSLVRWGYVVLVIDSFSPRNIQRLCEADDTIWKQFDNIRLADTFAGLEYLQSLPQVDANNIALMGWSYGGTIMLDMLVAAVTDNAMPSDFKAGVGIYPGCWKHLQGRVKSVAYTSTAPVLILMGESDDWTRPENCRALVAGTENDRNAISLHLYPNACHDFDNSMQRDMKLHGVRIESANASGTVAVGYNKAAHAAASKDVRRFLDAYLKRADTVDY